MQFGPAQSDLFVWLSLLDDWTQRLEREREGASKALEWSSPLEPDPHVPGERTSCVADHRALATVNICVGHTLVWLSLSSSGLFILALGDTQSGMSYSI